MRQSYKWVLAAVAVLTPLAIWFVLALYMEEHPEEHPGARPEPNDDWGPTEVHEWEARVGPNKTRVSLGNDPAYPEASEHWAGYTRGLEKVELGVPGYHIEGPGPEDPGYRAVCPLGGQDASVKMSKAEARQMMLDSIHAFQKRHNLPTYVPPSDLGLCRHYSFTQESERHFGRFDEPN